MSALHLDALDLEESTPSSSRGLGLDPGWGYILSEDTGSALDGPGLRTVYCLDGGSHDPDAWQTRGARRVHVDTLVNEVEQYAAFLPTVHGGVTLAGGEPLIQHGFCVRFLRRLQRLGIHTALATNGALGYRLDDAGLRSIDLVILDLVILDRVILDLASSAPPAAWRLTAAPQPTGALALARRLHALARPTWIRFRLAPGVTDRSEDVASLARFCGELTNVERVEVLAGHAARFGATSQALEPLSPPGDEVLQAVRDTFRRHGSICPD
jgi:pyruvate formate lyase activating enzyme